MLLRLENRLVYHPLRDTDDWVPPANSRVEDVWLRITNGGSIHAWWCPTAAWEPSQGAILYCHGNGGNLSHRRSAIDAWQRFAGKAVLIFDYPGYGKSPGRPSEVGCYAAADAAYDWLTEVRGVDPEHVILFGDSLGGGVAIELATRRPHQALILSKTFTSIVDMARSQFGWFPARWPIRNRYDNLAKIGLCRKPVFVAHGTADTLVPYALGERLFAAANEPKRFLPIEGTGHNDPLPPSFYSAVQHFLATFCLAKNAPRNLEMT